MSNLKTVGRRHDRGQGEEWCPLGEAGRERLGVQGRVGGLALKSRPPKRGALENGHELGSRL